MKINELLYKTPEMTEEKLLKIMDSHLNWIRKDLKDRIIELHKPSSLSQAILDEYDTIEDKKSFLTRSERNTIIGFVGTCMIEMTKGKEINGTGESKSTSND